MTDEIPPFPGRVAKMQSRFQARLRAYFLAGVLVTAPIAITVWLAWGVVNFFDHQVRSLIPSGYHDDLYLPLSIPGIGLIIVIFGLIAIGALTAGLVGRLIVSWSERVLASMPVVRNIYGAVKQIFETVLAQRSDAFREVVLVEFPRRGAWSLGFVTGRTEGELQAVCDEEMVNVFVPTTPNPTSGYLIFVPRSDVVALAMTVEEGIKMVVSTGIVTPPDRRPPELRARPGLIPGPERRSA